MTVKEKYQAFKEQYEAARKQMTDTASAAFKEFAVDFFNQFPTVKSFCWNQYTPYFNDGDPCEFSVNSNYYSIKINGINGYGDGEDGIECPGTWNGKTCAEFIDDPETEFCPKCGTALPEVLDEETHTKAAKAASEMLQNFDYDILEDLYGDHVEITVYRDGRATVEEYEHD